MLFKSPITLLSIAPKFSLLCPNYAPYGPLCSIRTWPTDCFIRVSRSFNFSWQGTAKIWRAKPRPWLRHWKTDMAFEGFAKFRGMILYNMLIMPALCSKLTYYASIMLDALACLLCLKLCWHNWCRPTTVLSIHYVMLLYMIPLFIGWILLRRSWK